MDVRPPALAERLVRLASPREDRDFLLADLRERFDAVVRGRGPAAARRWYWKQAASAAGWALVPERGPLGRRSWVGVTGDVRHGLRTVRRSRLYAFGFAATLGVGLAAATLTAAVAWAVWLAPMPYPDPDRVVRLWEVEPAEGGDVGAEGRRHRLSAGLLEELRRRRWTSLEAVSAALTDLPTPWTRDGERRLVRQAVLSPEGFGVLGIVPTLGRLPVETEREILLDEGFWRREFGANPDVVGTTVTLRGQSALVAGVGRVPEGFPGATDVVGVIEWSPDEERQVRFVGAIGRVRPGHSVAEADAELDAHLAALGATHPEHRGWGMEAVVLGDDLMRPFRGALTLLLASGLTFLLLAAVNVTSLVAARRVAGRQDRSVRLALGASEGRLLRGSVAESMVLAALGSGVGTLAAVWLIGPVRALVPQDVPRLDGVAVSGSLALLALSAGLLLGAMVGGAGHVASRGAGPSLRRAPGWRGLGGGGRRALVVGQVALTALLTAGAAAILDRVGRLGAIELGFEPEGLWSTVPEFQREYSATQWENTWAQVLDGLAARDVAAALSFNAPLKWEDRSVGMVPYPMEGRPEPILYQIHLVSPDYFDVMGIDVVAGRSFLRSDDAGAEKVVVVSAAFAEAYLPAGTPVEAALGEVLAPVMLMRGPSRVVGVVRPTRHHGPDEPLVPEVYIPFAQQITVGPSTLLVRRAREGAGEAVAAVLRQADPGMRWSPLRPYSDHVDAWFAPFRLQVVITAVLGTLGLLLASLGLYATLAYQVALRRHEMGIRKAVGATDLRLVLGVLVEGMALAAVGGALGLVGWYRLAPVAARLVVGIDAAGATVPLAVLLVVGASCTLAALVPALRATRVDPAASLKVE